MEPKIRTLNPSAMGHYDRKSILPYLRNGMETLLGRHGYERTGRYSVLDVGGGSGRFADAILEILPGSTCTVLDNSDFLLQRNAPHPRKKTVLGSAEDADRLLQESFHLVFCNLVLHHFVTDSYRGSLRKQREILGRLRERLLDGGHLLVIEDLPKGLIRDEVASFIINRVTSNKALSPFVKRMGSNTAGVGVCFLGKDQWVGQFASQGLEVVEVLEFPRWTHVSRVKGAILTLAYMRHGMYLLRAR